MILSIDVRKTLISIVVFVLLTSCVFNFITSPWILCVLDGECAGVTFTSVTGMFSRTVSIACFVTLITFLFKYRTSVSIYDKNVGAYEVYSPTTAAERRSRQLSHLLFAGACLFVILPINISRLIILYWQNSDLVVLIFFVFMYTENICLCLAEVHFVKLCHTLHRHFAKINADLERLDEEEIMYPVAASEPPAFVATRVTYAGDFYGPRADFCSNSRQHSVANAVEVLRIRHRLTRDAVYALIDLFGIPLGITLFNLCVMTLFDIYYQLFDVMGAPSRSLIFIYMWLIQYSLRFYVIILTAHKTTKEANRSKILTTDINNRYLDEKTKDELQLFFQQISSCAIEFTACDFFTLNTHLITSAIAAGTTYLVILLQFDGSQDYGGLQSTGNTSDIMFKLHSIKMRENLGNVISIALIASCVYSYLKAPGIMCILDKCNSLTNRIIVKAVCPQSVAVACLISRMTIMYMGRGAVFKYKKKIKEYELYFPINVGDANGRRFAIVVVSAVCAIMIVPVNAYKVYLLYGRFGGDRDGDVAATVFLFTALVYVQNASMCVTEIQFVAYCVGLHQKFQSINGEMSAMKSKTIAANGYPSVLKCYDEPPDGSRSTDSPAAAADAAEFCSSPETTAVPASTSPVNRIELLKMRHQFVSDAVKSLNDMYHIQLGLSLCVLFTMSLFDIYDAVSGEYNAEKTSILYFGWLAQYVFRFCMIVLTAHFTTTQAYKSKSLITDINNRYIDTNTKEQLQLFLNELCNRSVEFTTFEIFVLNTRLITSAIVAGTTYLVISLQFR